MYGIPYSHLISRVLNFAKNQEPYFASITFPDFERKLKLKCSKFREILKNLAAEDSSDSESDAVEDN